MGSNRVNLEELETNKYSIVTRNPDLKDHHKMHFFAFLTSLQRMHLVYSKNYLQGSLLDLEQATIHLIAASKSFSCDF